MGGGAARGFEGIVAKNPESRYVPGRTLAWLKVKQPHYREGERGWAPKQKPWPVPRRGCTVALSSPVPLQNSRPGGATPWNRRP